MLWLKCASEKVHQDLEFKKKKQKCVCMIWECPFKIAKIQCKNKSLTHVVTITTTTKKVVFNLNHDPELAEITTNQAFSTPISTPKMTPTGPEKRGRIPPFCRCLLLQMVITVFTSTWAKYPPIIGEFCVNPGSSLSLSRENVSRARHFCDWRTS